MPSLITPIIKDADPERVYIFPNKLNLSEIDKNSQKLHAMANEESKSKIYCLFDKLTPDTKYEICFPVSQLDLNKYELDDFKILKREIIVSCIFKSDFDQLKDALHQLQEYAILHGYTVKPPFRFLFTLEKKSKFSKIQDFTLEIQLPIKQNK